MKWLPLLFYMCYNKTVMREKRIKTYNIILCGMMAAILCVLAPMSIPTTIPITLGTFVIFIMTYILTYKYAFISCMIYILLGIIGLPVFSGYQGGIGKVIGPTGGYIAGYLFIALICGYINNRYHTNKVLQIIGMTMSVVICYVLGTLWFSYQQGMGIYESFIICVVPFIIGDILKIVVALVVGNVLRKRLNFRR